MLLLSSFCAYCPLKLAAAGRGLCNHVGWCRADRSCPSLDEDTGSTLFYAKTWRYAVLYRRSRLNTPSQILSSMTSCVVKDVQMKSSWRVVHRSVSQEAFQGAIVHVRSLPAIHLFLYDIEEAEDNDCLKRKKAWGCWLPLLTLWAPEPDSTPRWEIDRRTSRRESCV